MTNSEIKKEIEAYPIKEEKLSPAMEERIRKANVGSIIRWHDIRHTTYSDHILYSNRKRGR